MRNCDGFSSQSLTLTLLPCSRAPAGGQPRLTSLVLPLSPSHLHHGGYHNVVPCTGVPKRLWRRERRSQSEVEKNDRRGKRPAESHAPPHPSLLPVLREDSSPVPPWRHAGGCPPAPEAESQGTTRAWRRRRGGRRGTLQGRNGRGPKGE